jgi:hypothetical protein
MTLWINRLVPALLLLAVLVGAWKMWRSTGVRTGAGILAPDAPVQTISDRSAPFIVNSFSAQPLARFSFKARILSVEPYSWDSGAKISPIDLAVGWGRMSDSAVIDQLKISQGQRFFTYRYTTPPIPQGEIERSAANMHMIPADDDVEALLRQSRPGQIVEIEGYLVNVTGPQGFTWNSSLVREDTGPGACEVVYVQRVTLTRR